MFGGLFQLVWKFLTIIFLAVLGIILLVKSFLLMFVFGLSSTHYTILNQAMFDTVNPIFTYSCALG